MKYNFVFLSSDLDYYYYSFATSINNINTFFLSDKVFKTLKKSILFKIHMGRINRIIKLPFKQIWNRKFYNEEINNNLPICFVLWGEWALYNRETGFSEYLRKKYPGCKIVWFIQDLFSTQLSLYENHIDLCKEKKIYDRIVSYDKGDCVKYGFTYHPTVMSYMQIPDNPNLEETDVLFIGKDKGRLPLLIEICNYLREYGLICNFRLYGVPYEKRINVDGIYYYDSKLTYREIIEYVKKTKCIIELMQPEAQNFTLRTWEALLYNKYLITNNKSLQSSSFYCDKSMCVIDNIGDITQSFIEAIKSVEIQYDYQQQISPNALIAFLEKIL